MGGALGGGIEATPSVLCWEGGRQLAPIIIHYVYSGQVCSSRLCTDVVMCIIILNL